MLDLNFYKGKNVFITGHTGFKGSWLCEILLMAGANVTGFSLEPPTKPSLFEVADIARRMNSVIGDIRDFSSLKNAFDGCKPDIVFHLAAQPIVREGYNSPAYTYETNVMGTVNILECVRSNTYVKSFLNITTDKVYKNNEWEWGYRENERLDGYDPYSNSKSCSELVTQCYKRSFFENSQTAISTARAGNVIGGGDFAADRIIPDCIRAIENNKEIIVRNPYSTRPYQHVLEPLYVYLMIAEAQYDNHEFSGWYNVGPDDCDCVTTGDLADLFCKSWGEGASWKNVSEVNAPHEANFLKLDCSKVKKVFDWTPFWHIDTTMQKLCDWYKVYLTGGDVIGEMNKQISEFFYR